MAASGASTSGTTSPREMLGTPITNDMARAQAGRQPGAGYEQRQSARAIGDAGSVVDIGSRESVRLFYNRVHQQATPPMEWTGSHATGAPGDTGAAFKAATLQRVNWYRAMAGIPAAVPLSLETSAKAQQAALMMSAAGMLSHYPTADWKFYTPTGAQAAASSNLALGKVGPSAIESYMRDNGDTNAAVGHRRWLLQPKTRSIGTGDVPGGQVDGKLQWGANALWVTDVDQASPRPQVRDEFVAWPTTGFVPYATVFARWSVSYPGADFTQARVSATRDGKPLTVRQETVDNHYGENTLVWQMPDIDEASSHTRPEADLRYHISVSGVRVQGRERSFDYDVTVFDPAVVTPGSFQPVASAPAQVAAGQSYAASIGAAPNASGYSLSTYRLVRLGASNAAPIVAETWTTANGGNHAILDAGRLRLRVASDDWGRQAATLNKRLMAANTGARVLVRRTSQLATSTQTFRVQVSADDGANWNDVYTEAGRNTGTQISGVVSIPLAEYAGRVLRLRIVADVTGSAYVTDDSGWTVTDIGFEGVDELREERKESSADGRFTLSHLQPGAYLLVPRFDVNGLYESDPGIPATVLVDGAVLRGPRANYTLSRQGGVLTIVDRTGQDATQVVQSPLRIDFTDITLAFDVDGNAGQTYRLYRAAFNRQPDAGGLKYWIGAMDGGVDAEAMARAFVKSDEFTSLYGAAPTHAQIIKTIYRNVLHREPDEGGAAYWTQALVNGLSVERLLLDFSESAENKAQVASEMALGIAYPR